MIDVLKSGRMGTDVQSRCSCMLYRNCGSFCLMMRVPVLNNVLLRFMTILVSCAYVCLKLL
jgi:hypothetical protein